MGLPRYVWQWGGKIQAYKARVFRDGGWVDVAQGNAEGRMAWTIKFPAVSTSQVRLLVESRSEPTPSFIIIEAYE